ncbi:transient receptor potential cation channel subfamily V member 3-like [Xenia sp. Carnegie-2017]|uniref:transient receptor potential cation channel subfamily V member 3-like n=1 Tax=Xenia sp. Carnegie-2017 TaxID=2897299 RepID=UPI001F042514|nr:transient receptor potential cation channel subfamily V member 3-like [Xenia sp. Carnegie-2017]
MANSDNEGGKRRSKIGKVKAFEEMLLKDVPDGAMKANEPLQGMLEGHVDSSLALTSTQPQIVRNAALLHYLSTLASSRAMGDTFDFQFVKSLLDSGADVNTTDVNGQTILHEVARSWQTDVAVFLFQNGARIDIQDSFGRAPLHVAAAVDYPEMVEFLINNNANINIATFNELQTPIHYAAKNGACRSLKMLLAYDADIISKDSKNRTPLQLAAEMNRTKAAKLLLEEGAPAGVYDSTGNSALSLLIEKAPQVAMEALGQLHSIDHISRREYFFLDHLEGARLNDTSSPALTPLEVATKSNRLDIIMHPVIRRLISVKWRVFGKLGGIGALLLNLLYATLWTVLAVTIPTKDKDAYLPLPEKVWRWIIAVLIAVLTIYEIVQQVSGTLKVQKENSEWRQWRVDDLSRDLQYCHPRWPQERTYLEAEIKAVENPPILASSDYWFYYDWVALTLILATISSQLAFIIIKSDSSYRVYARFACALLLILWIRIMKSARPFEGPGAFVAIFGHIIMDILKWALLFLLIFIPYAASFWITFGSDATGGKVNGYNKLDEMLFNMFSMVVVMDYGYEDLERSDEHMARFLCGTFIIIMAIVLVNVLIAMLSDTFTRVYGNAVANSIMQRAKTIITLERSLSNKRRRRYYDYIRNTCSPEVVTIQPDVNSSDINDRKSVEEMRDDVKEMVDLVQNRFGRRYGKEKMSDLDAVKQDVAHLWKNHERNAAAVKEIRATLEKMLGLANNQDDQSGFGGSSFA